MNESQNKNLSLLRAVEGCKRPDYQEVTKIAATFAYSLMLIIALSGNAFVISVTRKRLTARNPFNFLIINLAASDILYAIFAVFIQHEYIFFGTLWFPGVFGVFLCKVKEFAFSLALVASILTLTFMAIEKHLAILYVMKTPLSTRNVCRVILLLWLISCFVSSTELIKLRVVSRPNDTGVSCIPVWAADKEKKITIFKIECTIKFFLLFVFPLVTMMTMYGRIIRFLWRRQLPGFRSTKNEIKIRKQSRRIVLMLVTMTVVFAVGLVSVHARLLDTLCERFLLASARILNCRLFSHFHESFLIAKNVH